MTDPEALAALHLRCFPAHPRPWSAGEFASLLESPLNFLLAQPQGFLGSVRRPPPPPQRTQFGRRGVK